MVDTQEVVEVEGVEGVEEDMELLEPTTMESMMVAAWRRVWGEVERVEERRWTREGEEGRARPL